MTFDDLVKVALIGTARAAALESGAPDAALAEALAAVRTGHAEDDLLAAAALLSAYEACGRSSGTKPAETAVPALDDERSACSRRAGELLAHLMTMPNATAKRLLLGEWLLAANTAKRRVPHALLPTLLDYGKSTTAVRDAIAVAIDRRGAWLIAQNPQWQFTATESEDAATVWANGTRPQRVSALRHLRAVDPAAARGLIESTWKEDAADERAAFVAELAVNVVPADEAFLESALDDRSKQVRAAAAAVLRALPMSALVGRMHERVEPLLVFTPPRPGGLLRSGQSAVIELRLPLDTFDPTWFRDGVEEKPTDRTGRRQWWATQLLAAVPPSVWSERWQLPPDACIAAAAGEFRPLLLDAWSTAAERHDDTAWMHALLLDSIHAPDEASKKITPRLSLLRRLPPPIQRGLIVSLLHLPRLDTPALVSVLESADIEFDSEAADAAITAVEQHVRANGRGYDYALAGVLDPLAHRLPPAIVDELAARWSGPAWDANRRTLDGFFHTLQLRRDIRTEFTP